MVERRNILVINAGSSSVKFATFDTALTPSITGVIADIGGAATLTLDGVESPISIDSHLGAIQAIMDILIEKGVQPSSLSAAAHRVVHGGAELTQPVLISADVLARIASCTPLAPLHNPHNLAAIDAIAQVAPDLPQYASFDTSFHATNPDVATRYAIPETDETQGIRRYGFHGLSYASLVESLPSVAGEKLPDRLLAFHLGNGASLCAIKTGKSVATTMGYSPIDGLTMGTRCGGIDANAVLRLVELYGLTETKGLLNNQSGLLGLSGGKSDMRRLMLDTSADSAFAIDHFCYWSARHAGSLVASMGGIDAIAFTGGIGENAVDVRQRISHNLEWLGIVLDPDANRNHGPRLHAQSSTVSAWVIPANEERMIASDALRLMTRS